VLVLAILVLSAAAIANAPPRAASETLRLQVMLDRAGFSPGEIDGRSGTNTRRALLAFQRSHGLPASGAPSRATWRALESDAPTLIDHTLSAADVTGPFEPIPEDMMEKSRLPALGYTSALEAIAEKFHSSPELITSLNPHSAWDQGETLRVPNVEREAEGRKAAKVIVDGNDFSVTALDDKGKVIRSYPATMGSEHDPLPIGEWKIQGVSRHPPFFYNPDLFWDADESHAKVKIAPGPNNPVGVVWIDLSKEHYGIHGTPEPRTVGKTQSHGCIRLTNWDAAELADLVKPGTPAILTRGRR
jgi:lipoprotein-anchoring transpeptidase ErfK/SrfK